MLNKVNLGIILTYFVLPYMRVVVISIKRPKTNAISLKFYLMNTP